MPVVLNGAFAQFIECGTLEVDSAEVELMFPGFKNASFYISRPTDDDPKWHGTFEFYSGSWPAHEYLEADTLHGVLGLARTKWDNDVRRRIEIALEQKALQVEREQTLVIRGDA